MHAALAEIGAEALEDNNSLILTHKSNWFDKAIVESNILMTECVTLKHSCSCHS